MLRISSLGYIFKRMNWEVENIMETQRKKVFEDDTDESNYVIKSIKTSGVDEEEVTDIIRQVNSLLKYVTELDYVKSMLLDANKQAEMVEGIAASSQEMTATIEDISHYVQESHQTTTQSIEVANNSINQITTSFEQVEKSFEASKRVQTIMENVNSEAKKINDMVGIIKGVADQTNLLALNASIEAARAGEHGRGFAVVADEIKKLAESTKQQVAFINETVNALSKEIQNTDDALEEANSSFAEGKEQMDDAVGSLDTVRVGLDGIGKSFGEISTNIDQQTAASQEMASSVMIVNEKTNVLRGETDKTGRAFNDVSRMINDIRLNALNKVDGMDMKTQIEICVSDHLIWRWRVYNMILGYEILDENDVGTHHDCRLGKWCDQVEQSSPQISELIKGMERPHSDLHILAKKAIREYNQGNKDQAEATLGQMDIASKAVVEYLNRLKKL